MTHASVFVQRLKIVSVESAVASAAATASGVLLEWPVWAMFIGWISYFTRGANARAGLVNLACVATGMAIGVLAAIAMSALGVHLGAATLGVVVFGVAMVVLPLRHVPVFNNLLAFFLGLVAWFAAHQPPSAMAWLVLMGAATLGAAAAWIAGRLHARLAPASPQGSAHP